MNSLKNEPRTIWQRTCYIGITLVIVGYVSFTNHERIGDVLQVIGAALIIVSKAMKWRQRRGGFKVNHSNT